MLLAQALTSIYRGRPTAPPPYAISDMELIALGYVLPTWSPYNADSTGVVDAKAAIQAAIDAAYAAQKPVWFSPGTYLITDTLRCYMWATKATGSANTGVHQLFGASYPSRPILKIEGSAFDSSPRPMVAFAKWRPVSSQNQPAPTGPVTGTPTTVNHIPSSPYIAPAAAFWTQATSVLYTCGFYNIDLDTSAKANADGICFASAQGCHLGNTRIVATGSHYGVQGLPGRSSACMNIEVQGGAVGVSTKSIYSSIGSIAGAMVAGLYCYDQTTACIEVGDFVPLAVTGFYFRRTSGSVWTVDNATQTAANGATLIDGIIETASGIAIDNTNSQPLYMRRVYVIGTGNLVKSGAAATVTGTGTYKLINEYSANAFTGSAISAGTPQNGATALQHFAYQDGVSTRVQEHANSVTSSAAAPPGDLITQHIVTFPMVDQAPFINITASPYNAVAGSSDSLAAINAAVAAAAVAGHNRVFAPLGVFRISNTLSLTANTILWGLGSNFSAIRPRDSWVPADSTSPYIVDQADSAAGTGRLAWVGIQERMNVANNDIGRFSHLRWRAGRGSATFGVGYDHDAIGGNTQNHAWGRTVFTVSGNGGGRHYGHYTDGDGNNGANFRAIKVTSTTEPLAIYGFNCEAAASFGSSTLPESAYPAAYMEVTSAANVRVYSCKREGQSPTIRITDSTNVGLFSGGGMRDGEVGPTLTPTFVSRFHEVLGNCEGIVMANLCPQNFTNGTSTAVDYTLYEEEANAGVLWPNGVALYKRGYASYDDSLMAFS